MAVCQDHLGNTYESFSEMCKCWEIAKITVTQRLRRGMTLEQALTKPLQKRKKKACTDHLGNKFESVYEICKHYKIQYSTLYYKTSRGVPLKEILESEEKSIKPVRTMDEVNKILHRRGITVQDHLGNKYRSMSFLAKAYNINDSTLRQRLLRGETLEEALTSSDKLSKTVTDHLGIEYKSVRDLCKAYNISESAYRQRIRRGQTLVKALTTPTNTYTKRESSK